MKFKKSEIKLYVCKCTSVTGKLNENLTKSNKDIL